MEASLTSPSVQRPDALFRVCMAILALVAIPFVLPVLPAAALERRLRLSPLQLEGTIFAEIIQTPTDDRANHHLWQNGRLWWIAFTIHRPDWTKHRIRLSLKTADLDEARRRRDRLLNEFRQRDDCQLSLRLPGEARTGAG